MLRHYYVIGDPMGPGDRTGRRYAGHTLLQYHVILQAPRMSQARVWFAIIYNIVSNVIFVVVEDSISILSDTSSTTYLLHVVQHIVRWLHVDNSGYRWRIESHANCSSAKHDSNPGVVFLALLLSHESPVGTGLWKWKRRVHLNIYPLLPLYQTCWHKFFAPLSCREMNSKWGYSSRSFNRRWHSGLITAS